MHVQRLEFIHRRHGWLVLLSISQLVIIATASFLTECDKHRKTSICRSFIVRWNEVDVHLQLLLGYSKRFRQRGRVGVRRRLHGNGPHILGQQRWEQLYHRMFCASVPVTLGRPIVDLFHLIFRFSKLRRKKKMALYFCRVIVDYRRV